MEAYDALLLDAMRGDHTLFNTAEGIEPLWDRSTPLLEDPPPVKMIRRAVGAQRHPSTHRAERVAACPRARVAGEKGLTSDAETSHAAGHQPEQRAHRGSHQNRRTGCQRHEPDDKPSEQPGHEAPRPPCTAAMARRRCSPRRSSTRRSTGRAQPWSERRFRVLPYHGFGQPKCRTAATNSQVGE